MIQSTPHITIVFMILVVDLPIAYGLVLAKEWIFPLGGYLMNNGNCMMLPNKDNQLTRITREPKNLVSFEKNKNNVMLEYITQIG